MSDETGDPNILMLDQGPGGNYLEKMRRELPELRKQIKLGQMTQVHFNHDDWCALLGEVPKPCNCDPDIVLIPLGHAQAPGEA